MEERKRGPRPSSCRRCYIQHLKCDKTHPCNRCVNNKSVCEPRTADDVAKHASRKRRRRRLAAAAAANAATCGDDSGKAGGGNTVANGSGVHASLGLTKRHMSSQHRVAAMLDTVRATSGHSATTSTTSGGGNFVYDSASNSYSAVTGSAAYAPPEPMLPKVPTTVRGPFIATRAAPSPTHLPSQPRMGEPPMPQTDLSHRLVHLERVTSYFASALSSLQHKVEDLHSIIAAHASSASPPTRSSPHEAVNTSSVSPSFPSIDQLVTASSSSSSSSSSRPPAAFSSAPRVPLSSAAPAGIPSISAIGAGARGPRTPDVNPECLSASLDALMGLSRVAADLVAETGCVPPTLPPPVGSQPRTRKPKTEVPQAAADTSSSASSRTVSPTGSDGEPSPIALPEVVHPIVNECDPDDVWIYWAQRCPSNHPSREVCMMAGTRCWIAAASSPAAQRLFGMPSLRGQWFSTLVDPVWWSERSDALDQYRAHMPPETLTHDHLLESNYVFRRADGSRFQALVAVHVLTIVEEPGNLVFLFTLSDIRSIGEAEIPPLLLRFVRLLSQPREPLTWMRAGVESNPHTPQPPPRTSSKRM